MKRKLDHSAYLANHKKTKTAVVDVTINNLEDDCLCIIFSFLESFEIYSHCLLVNKQWEMCCYSPMSHVTISSHNFNSKSQFLHFLRLFHLPSMDTNINDNSSHGCCENDMSSRNGQNTSTMMSLVRNIIIVHDLSYEDILEHYFPNNYQFSIEKIDLMYGTLTPFMKQFYEMPYLKQLSISHIPQLKSMDQNDHLLHLRVHNANFELLQELERLYPCLQSFTANLFDEKLSPILNTSFKFPKSMKYLRLGLSSLLENHDLMHLWSAIHLISDTIESLRLTTNVSYMRRRSSGGSSSGDESSSLSSLTWQLFENFPSLNYLQFETGSICPIMPLVSNLIQLCPSLTTLKLGYIGKMTNDIIPCLKRLKKLKCAIDNDPLSSSVIESLDNLQSLTINTQVDFTKFSHLTHLKISETIAECTVHSYSLQSLKFSKILITSLDIECPNIDTLNLEGAVLKSMIIKADSLIRAKLPFCSHKLYIQAPKLQEISFNICDAFIKPHITMNVPMLRCLTLKAEWLDQLLAAQPSIGSTLERLTTRNDVFYVSSLRFISKLTMLKELYVQSDEMKLDTQLSLDDFKPLRHLHTLQTQVWDEIWLDLCPNVEYINYLSQERVLEFSTERHVLPKLKILRGSAIKCWNLVTSKLNQLTTVILSGPPPPRSSLGASESLKRLEVHHATQLNGQLPELEELALQSFPKIALRFLILYLQKQLCPNLRCLYLKSDAKYTNSDFKMVKACCPKLQWLSNV